MGIGIFRSEVDLLADVSPCAECVFPGTDDHHAAHGGVRARIAERSVELEQQCLVQRVVLAGSIQRDQQHPRLAFPIGDDERHDAGLATGRSASCKPIRGARKRRSSMIRSCVEIRGPKSICRRTSRSTSSPGATSVSTRPSCSNSKTARSVTYVTGTFHRLAYSPLNEICSRTGTNFAARASCSITIPSSPNRICCLPA